jgi:hypothetical protein
MMKAVRLIAILGALNAWTALALEFARTLAADANQGQGGLFSLWQFFGYLTELTNLWVALTLTHAAIRPESRKGLGHPRMELAATSSILFVGAAYFLLLSQSWTPEGWPLISDRMLQYTSPALCTLFWLLRPCDSLKWRDVALCLAWPLAYIVYGLARGALDGWYPYWFLDPTAGLGQLAYPIAGLLLGALAISLGLVALDRLRGRVKLAPAEHEGQGVHV